MEGGVYLCQWKREGRKFRGWVKRHQKVSVVVTDVEELAEALAEEICGWNGDGEAVLEFVPDLPSSPESPNWLDRKTVVLLGFGRYVGTNLSDRSAWVKPPCSRCHFSDARNRKFKVVLEKKPGSDLAADAEYFYRTFVSKRLAELLDLAGFGITLQPVDIKDRSRAEFFELTAKPTIRVVGVKGATYDKYVSHVCPKCKTARIFPTVAGHWDIQEFLAGEDLDEISASVFVIGRPGGRNAIGMRREHWNKLRSKPGTKGVTTSLVGIVTKPYVVRHPKLPVLPRS